MSDPDQPKVPRKGQFQKGNKASKGRPKGAENKFGPGFREKLLAGIIASGEKKARKNGVNGKVDGFAYFVESLVDGNGGAAATLIAKMLPSEPPPAVFTGPGVIINVQPVDEGQHFAPGLPDVEVLMPFAECTRAWAAFNAGTEAWTEYLVRAEGMLTPQAFANLSRVVAPDRAKLPPSEPKLRLVAQSPTDEEAQLLAQLKAFAAQSPGTEKAQLIAEIEAIARRVARLAKSVDGDDAA